MRIGDFLAESTRRLSAVGIEAAELEAAFLLGHFLQRNRAALFLHRDEQIPDHLLPRAEKALARRLCREPLAYILGEQEFWSRVFEVTPAVLIPRPETERIVEHAMELFAEREQRLHIVDLGTGSGILAVVLAHEFPRAFVVAVDRSAAALQVAARNARRHEVDARVALVHGDWLSSFAKRPFFDLVVANPPYIVPESLAGLQPEVIDHEPRGALDGGEGGMAYVRQIGCQAARVLLPGGWILMEIGADQQEETVNYFVSLAKYDRVVVHRDYAGLPRVLQAQRTFDS